MHLHQILMHGLRPRFYSLTSLEEDPSGTLDHASDGSVRAIIVCSPSNPTGQVLRQETVERIHEWSLAHGAWVLSDEAYEDFVFEGEPARMAAIDARLPGTSLHMDANVVGYHGIGRGTGRIRGVDIAVRTEAKGMRPKSTTIFCGKQASTPRPDRPRPKLRAV